MLNPNIYEDNTAKQDKANDSPTKSISSTEGYTKKSDVDVEEVASFSKQTPIKYNSHNSFNTTNVRNATNEPCLEVPMPGASQSHSNRGTPEKRGQNRQVFKSDWPNKTYGITTANTPASLNKL